MKQMAHWELNSSLELFSWQGSGIRRKSTIIIMRVYNIMINLSDLSLCQVEISSYSQSQPIKPVNTCHLSRNSLRCTRHSQGRSNPTDLWYTSRRRRPRGPRSWLELDFGKISSSHKHPSHRGLSWVAGCLPGDSSSRTLLGPLLGLARSF